MITLDLFNKSCSCRFLFFPTRARLSTPYQTTSITFIHTFFPPNLKLSRIVLVKLVRVTGRVFPRGDSKSWSSWNGIGYGVAAAASWSIDSAVSLQPRSVFFIGWRMDHGFLQERMDHGVGRLLSFFEQCPRKRFSVASWENFGVSMLGFV